jgi:hypothetical protein
MKKFLFLTLIFGAIISTNTYAQAGDPPSALQQIKDKIRPLMVEKTGLTEAQADKIIEINYELRESMRAHANLSEADRAKKVAELKVTRDKKYSEIPLTAEQIAAVKTFYEDMGKNRPQKSGN